MPRRSAATRWRAPRRWRRSSCSKRVTAPTPIGAATSFATGLPHSPIVFRSIREVRGLGLMIGVEIQSEAGEPDPALRDELIDLAFHRGLLLLPCGPSTVRFCPPLCVNRRQVEIGLELFAATLEAAAGESKRA